MVVLRSILVLLVVVQGIVLPACPCNPVVACAARSSRRTCCATTAQPSSSSCTIVNPCCCGAKPARMPAAASRSETSPRVERSELSVACVLLDFVHDAAALAPAPVPPRDLAFARPSQAALQVFRI